VFRLSPWSGRIPAEFPVLRSTWGTTRVLDDFAPDVICLGYDQQAFTDKLEAELAKRKLSTKIVRLPSYKPEEFKSTIIKKKTVAVSPVMISSS